MESYLDRTYYVWVLSLNILEFEQGVLTRENFLEQDLKPLILEKLVEPKFQLIGQNW